MDARRLGLTAGVVGVALILLAWWMGWLGGGSTTTPSAVTTPQPATTAANDTAPTAPATRAPAKPAGQPCSVPPDVLPVPAAQGDPTAHSTYIGAGPDGGATWTISGLISRCAETGSFSIDIPTPPEMGKSKTAALQMSISGVTFQPENEARENKATEWGLASQPTIEVKDSTASAPSANVLTIRWQAYFNNILSYEMAYTLYLTQRQ